MKSKIQIVSRYDSTKVLFEGKFENLEQAVVAAIAAKADLRFADLSSADLRSADLSSADLSSANLSSANLRFADLRSANLRSANLRSADLRFADLSSADLSSADLSSADLSSADLSSANLSFADLSSAKISWSSHDLLAEILRREAGDDLGKLQAAGLLLMRRDWCWPEFLALDIPEKQWALETLAKWADDNAPSEIQALAKKLSKAKAATEPAEPAVTAQ